ncbi:MAG: lysophospholipase, partial [Alphaproteobacteria bacterium]
MTTWITRMVRVGLAAIVSACTPGIQPGGPVAVPPSLCDQWFTTRDGMALPVRSWQPETEPPRAVLLALHGFNDYSNAFNTAGPFLAKQGILVYAYDQRGFGRAPYPGLWPGTQRLIDDLHDIAQAIRQRHPGIPLHLLGDSMGGAVVMVASTSPTPPPHDGLILVAPAVWGRSTMPWPHRIALFLTAHTMPWLKLSGRGLRIVPSDNIEMLRSLSRDPLVIKETRTDTVHGLADLMDEAVAAAKRLGGPTLLLYGARDEVVPENAMAEAIRSLPPAPTVAVYEEGYHMLLRDLKASVPLGDIA